MRPPVSAVIITLDEAEKLPACLASVAWCDEVVVLDSGSTDATCEIARRAGARVHVQPFAGYGRQKNAAAALARHDWVLNLDADERVDDALRRAVQGCAFDRPAYRFRREGMFLGRPHRPMHKARVDAPVRLYDRRVCGFTEAAVHEEVVAPTAGVLPGVLLHDSFRSISDQVARFDKYSSLLVEQTPQVRASPLRLLLRPLVHVLWSLFRQGAVRDGQRGFILSALWGYHDLLVEAKRFERDHYRRDAPDTAAAPLDRPGVDTLRSHRADVP